MFALKFHTCQMLLLKFDHQSSTAQFLLETSESCLDPGLKHTNVPVFSARLLTPYQQPPILTPYFCLNHVQTKARLVISFIYFFALDDDVCLQNKKEHSIFEISLFNFFVQPYIKVKEIHEKIALSSSNYVNRSLNLVDTRQHRPLEQK